MRLLVAYAPSEDQISDVTTPVSHLGIIAHGLIDYYDR